MNEKARDELIRQLAEGCRFFYRCPSCRETFMAEEPCDGCPICEVRMVPDLHVARVYYAGLIDGALAWGSR